MEKYGDIYSKNFLKTEDAMVMKARCHGPLLCRCSQRQSQDPGCFIKRWGAPKSRIHLHFQVLSRVLLQSKIYS